VAPHAGVVGAVRYQANGAGHYLVLNSDDEDYDYVFMHLRSRSIAVAEGDHVRTGERVGEVGRTGRSSGPHLHFEIWLGGWQAGGEPIAGARAKRQQITQGANLGSALPLGHSATSGQHS
jgi:murein DD-endopeptidase MepM/ murein hydrolase activator NlpD